MDNTNILRTGFFAPEFSLPDSDGEIFSLVNRLADRNLALCFVPARPGERIKNYLRDLNSGLPATAAGVPVEVAAVVPDKPNALIKLKDDLKLAFPLLSDQKLMVSRRYYLVDSNSFGTSVYFSVFVIDSEQVVRYRISEQPGLSEYDPGKLREAISTLF